MAAALGTSNKLLIVGEYELLFVEGADRRLTSALRPATIWPQKRKEVKSLNIVEWTNNVQFNFPWSFNPTRSIVELFIYFPASVVINILFIVFYAQLNYLSTHISNCLAHFGKCGTNVSMFNFYSFWGTFIYKMFLFNWVVLVPSKTFPEIYFSVLAMICMLLLAFS